ncbi:MAG: sulfotransferase [Sphingomonadales bacterium]
MTERPPIIIVGANHSGTRLLVDMLRVLGSAAGRIGNEWLEDEGFLEIHRRLIGKVTGKRWTEAIFDLRFVREYRDEGLYVAEIKTWLEDTLPPSFPDRTRPWHWKCPTTALFLQSWIEIYPDALYVHLERDPLEVARSLVRRRQFLGFGRAAAFCEAMNQRVLDARPAMKNYLRISVENLAEELPVLAGKAGLAPTGQQLAEARGMIRPAPLRGWRSNRSLLGNLWEAATNARAAVHARGGRRRRGG